MSAQEAGGYLGIQVDQQGFVTESSIANVVILDREGVAKTTPFDGRILSGTTVQRAYDLHQSMMDSGVVQAFEFAHFTALEAQEANEVMLFGGGSCVPVVKLDGKAVGTGRPGPAFQAFHAALAQDMRDTPSAHLDPIPGLA